MVARRAIGRPPSRDAARTSESRAASRDGARCTGENDEAMAAEVHGGDVVLVLPMFDALRVERAERRVW
jgi:hypothetical protein